MSSYTAMQGMRVKNSMRHEGRLTTRYWTQLLKRALDAERQDTAIEKELNNSVLNFWGNPLET